MTVGDIARRDVISAPPRATVAEIASLMNEHGVGSVVIAENDRPIGIVTDRDIAMRVTAEGMDSRGLIAADVMTPDPVTIHRDAGVKELIDTFAENEVRRMPVVNDDELYGIVTLDDVDRLLADEHQAVGRVIAAESPPY